MNRGLIARLLENLQGGSPENTGILPVLYLGSSLEESTQAIDQRLYQHIGKAVDTHRILDAREQVKRMTEAVDQYKVALAGLVKLLANTDDGRALGLNLDFLEDEKRALLDRVPKSFMWMLNCIAKLHQIIREDCHSLEEVEVAFEAAHEAFLERCPEDDRQRVVEFARSSGPSPCRVTNLFLGRLAGRRIELLDLKAVDCHDDGQAGANALQPM